MKLLFIIIITALKAKCSRGWEKWLLVGFTSLSSNP